MPKNKGRGGKRFRKGKKNTAIEEVKTLIRKKDGQEYAKVIKVLGDRRLIVKCFDDRERIGHIPGKFRKRVWINMDDFVLVNLRCFNTNLNSEINTDPIQQSIEIKANKIEDDKCDIVYKYTPQEMKKLCKLGEVTSNFLNIDTLFDTKSKTNQNLDDDNFNNDGIYFEEDYEEKIVDPDDIDLDDL